jgi:putative acetyltransferase
MVINSNPKQEFMNKPESPLFIRKCRKEDNLSLALMIRDVFTEHKAPTAGTVFSDPTTDDLFQLFLTPNSILWVAEINKKPIGCCGIFPTAGLPDDTAELVKFYLAAGVRGKGIGKILLKQSIVSAKEFGYKKIYLESFPVFESAIAIYEKLGFVRLPAAMGNSGHTACNVWMLKVLE